jgi:hypothetical protein
LAIKIKEGNYYKMRLKEIFNYQRPAELRQLACALTFCGGFVDAYTYIYSKGDIRFLQDKLETSYSLVLL